jgi:hypothetical protein
MESRVSLEDTAAIPKANVKDGNNIYVQSSNPAGGKTFNHTEKIIIKIRPKIKGGNALISTEINKDTFSSISFCFEQV